MLAMEDEPDMDHNTIHTSARLLQGRVASNSRGRKNHDSHDLQLTKADMGNRNSRSGHPNSKLTYPRA